MWNLVRSDSAVGAKQVLGEPQHVIELGGDDRFDDIEIQLVVLVNGDVAESHHACQGCGYRC